MVRSELCWGQWVLPDACIPNRIRRDHATDCIETKWLSRGRKPRKKIRYSIALSPDQSDGNGLRINMEEAGNFLGGNSSEGSTSVLWDELLQ